LVRSAVRANRTRTEDLPTAQCARLQAKVPSGAKRCALRRASTPCRFKPPSSPAACTAHRGHFKEPHVRHFVSL
jgi:hypothetical protein